MKIVVYSKNKCYGCDKTKERLSRKLNCPFEERNIETNSEWEAECKAFGFLSAPVVVVYSEEGNELVKWSGFDPYNLDQWAKKVKGQ